MILSLLSLVSASGKRELTCHVGFICQVRDLISKENPAFAWRSSQGEQMWPVIRVLSYFCFSSSFLSLSQFYKEHVGRPFFDGLIGFMTSGPAIALSLRKENAIKDWYYPILQHATAYLNRRLSGLFVARRVLCGPTNSDKAREMAPNRCFAARCAEGGWCVVDINCFVQFAGPVWQRRTAEW
jgi:hypothetical protein